jgi:phosphoenolpyruvate phosphomutase
MSIEQEIASVSEVFRLQNVQELQKSEERYLPTVNATQTSALVLAASQGDFGELVKDRPKAMLRLRGKPILSWHIDAFRRHGIRRIGAVRGYCKEAVDFINLHYFDNDAHQTTGELASLYAARDFLEGDMVITYGDILFDDYILENLLRQDDGGVAIAVDAAWKLRGRNDAKRDLVITTGTYDPLGDSSCELKEISSNICADDASGEWTGLVYLKAPQTSRVVHMLNMLATDEPDVLQTGDLPELLNRMVAKGEVVRVVHSYGHWYDLDHHKDLLLASEEVLA